MAKLTVKRQAFVNEYLHDLNQTQAAIRAGYSAKSAAKIASELMQIPAIQDAIAVAMAERSRRTGVNADRVVRELAKVAFANAADVIDFCGATVKNDATEDDTAAIASVKVKIIPGEDGDGVEREIKMADKLKALELLGKHMGMFTDKLQVNGALPVQIVDDIPARERCGVIQLSKVMAPSFYGVHRDTQAACHTHYWLKGGRGSTKSSFVGLEIVFGIMRDAERGQMTHALVLRRYEVTCRGSVYEQVKWAIEALGVADQWDCGVSPMQITYRPTGQKIFFRGADDITKVKSIKIAKGWIKYTWYEELNEFEGMEKIRALNQSIMRGGDAFLVFYTYNPPKSAGSWVNREAQVKHPDRLVHHSDYRTVPREWLGEPFLLEAEHLKAVNETAYKHEYLGEVTGTGGEVFANLRLEEITDKQIAIFDHIRNGLDWGYAADPFHYGRLHYDKTRRRLYIFNEIHQVRLSNRVAAEKLKPIVGSEIITCDSAEPKSIDEMKGYGLRVRGAKKGPDSVEYGIKWLQDLEEIIIDPERCPNTAREFSEYELERGKEGNFKAGYPDKNNHSIDASRYACEDDMKKPGLSVLK